MTKGRALALLAGLFLGSPLSAGLAAADEAPAGRGKEQILGGGVAVTLPPGMALKQNPNLLKMKDVEQWDYRLRSGPVSMALTGIGFAVPKDASPRAINTKDITIKAVAQYLPQSTVSTVEPVAFSTGRVTGHYATLNARDGQSFAIGFDDPRRCVTSMVIGAGVHEKMAITYSVTIGSDDCDSDAHRAAVAAVAGMRPV